jgi:hypothetical protein
MSTIATPLASTLSKLRGRLRLRHRVALGCVLAVSCLAAMAVAAENASASAYGVQYWGPFTVNIGGQSVGIPSGQLAHLIEGTGTFVTKDGANFAAAANVCNWRIDFSYADAVTGVVYSINRGPTQFVCGRAGQRVVFPNTNMRPGKACAELYSNGAFIARQCHSILR